MISSLGRPGWRDLVREVWLLSRQNFGAVVFQHQMASKSSGGEDKIATMFCEDANFFMMVINYEKSMFEEHVRSIIIGDGNARIKLAEIKPASFFN